MVHTEHPIWFQSLNREALRECCSRSTPLVRGGGGQDWLKPKRDLESDTLNFAVLSTACSGVYALSYAKDHAHAKFH